MKVVSELSGEACDEGSGECGDRMVRIARIMLAEKKTYLYMLDYSSNASKALKLPGDRKTRDR